MGTKNNPGNIDCYSRALPDEHVFVLLGRDPAMAPTIRFWRAERELLGKNVDPDDLNKLDEAAKAADDAEIWRAKIIEAVGPDGILPWHITSAAGPWDGEDKPVRMPVWDGSTGGPVKFDPPMFYSEWEETEHLAVGTFYANESKPCDSEAWVRTLAEAERRGWQFNGDISPFVGVVTHLFRRAQRIDYSFHPHVSDHLTAGGKAIPVTSVPGDRYTMENDNFVTITARDIKTILQARVRYSEADKQAVKELITKLGFSTLAELLESPECFPRVSVWLADNPAKGKTGAQVLPDVPSLADAPDDRARGFDATHAVEVQVSGLDDMFEDGANEPTESWDKRGGRPIPQPFSLTFCHLCNGINGAHSADCPGGILLNLASQRGSILSIDDMPEITAVYLDGIDVTERVRFAVQPSASQMLREFTAGTLGVPYTPTPKQEEVGPYVIEFGELTIDGPVITRHSFTDWPEWLLPLALPARTEDSSSNLAKYIEAQTDLSTHYRAWRDALSHRMRTAPSEERGYWDHELRAFDRTFTTLGYAPSGEGNWKKPIPRMVKTHASLSAPYGKGLPDVARKIVSGLRQIAVDMQTMIDATNFEAMENMTCTRMETFVDRVRGCAKELGDALPAISDDPYAALAKAIYESPGPENDCERGAIESCRGRALALYQQLSDSQLAEIAEAMLGRRGALAVLRALLTETPDIAAVCRFISLAEGSHGRQGIDLGNQQQP